ncbi:MAG TPA: hypothetical protein VMU26_27905 [Candidatus Polarisedimenticolia bacterium]|nr:hypothetical protein [Candidatus Polarisedimenticolia bacterium]
MFRRDGNSAITIIVLGATLLACPRGMFAQHGGGGGRIGGSSAGGGGLSSGNHASGVDAKDDLRNFHQIMAVQASSEQKVAYAAIVKSTAAAGAELQRFVELLSKGQNAPEVARHDKSFEEAIETARTLNKRFLEGFSEVQKSGLKEITKRLGKADSELAQQAKVLDQEVEANAAAPQMAGSAQNLERTLTIFQGEQADLGEEMSIAPSSKGQDSAFNLPPVKNTVKFSDQAITVITSGVVSNSVAEGGGNTFAVQLTADMSDLQQTIADVLRVRLDQADRCGERIAVQTAALTPQGSVAVVTTQLHYERWTCNTMFGRENMNEMVEGNGTIEVKMTPAVAEDGTLRLVTQLGRVEAEGLVGELLRSSTLGETLCAKISDSVLSALLQGGDFKAALPAGARSYATLRRAQFQGTGLGRLITVLNGEIRVSNENLLAVTSQLRERSLQSPQGSAPRPELVAR